MKLYMWTPHFAIDHTKEGAIDQLTGQYHQYLITHLDKRDECYKVYSFDQYVYDMCELFKKKLEKVLPFEFDMRSIGGLSYK